MGAIASSIAALSPLGSGAIWKKIVKHTTLLNETCTTSRQSASFQMGKGRLAYFSPKCSAIIPLFKGFWKNISPFSYVAPFGYELTTTRQTRALTFWRNFAYLLSVTQKFNRDATSFSTARSGMLELWSTGLHPSAKKSCVRPYDWYRKSSSVDSIETDCRQSGQPSHVVRLNARHAEFIRRRWAASTLWVGHELARPTSTGRPAVTRSRPRPRRTAAHRHAAARTRRHWVMSAWCSTWWSTWPAARSERVAAAARRPTAVQSGLSRRRMRTGRPRRRWGRADVETDHVAGWRARTAASVPSAADSPRRQSAEVAGRRRRRRRGGWADGGRGGRRRCRGAGARGPRGSTARPRRSRGTPSGAARRRQPWYDAVAAAASAAAARSRTFRV